MVRLTDRPDMTIAVYRGHKTIQHKNTDARLPMVFTPFDWSVRGELRDDISLILKLFSVHKLHKRR